MFRVIELDLILPRSDLSERQSQQLSYIEIATKYHEKCAVLYHA